MIYNTIVRVVDDVSADTPEQAALQLCESLAEAGFTAYRDVDFERDGLSVAPPANESRGRDIDVVPSLVQNHPQGRTPTRQAGDTVRFRTVTDTELRPRNDTTATVTGVITEPDETHDAEVLPMYRITFADGHETEAFGDELHDQEAAS